MLDVTVKLIRNAVVINVTGYSRKPASNTTAVLGKAVLGKMILGKA